MTTMAARALTARQPPVAAAARARTVGGPLAPLARMTADQLIKQIADYEATSASNTYALGLCLRELSQPRRYHDELGFESFEALLEARSLPTRMTAYKLITVVSTYSEREVQALGGTEKSYAVARYAKKEKPDGDPKRFLAPNARVAGRTVAEMSARDINRELGGKQRVTAAAKAAAKKASSRLGRALTRATVTHHMRVHPHKGACVSVHLDAEGAEKLVSLLARLHKLEKGTK